MRPDDIDFLALTDDERADELAHAFEAYRRGLRQGQIVAAKGATPLEGVLRLVAAGQRFARTNEPSPVNEAFLQGLADGVVVAEAQVFRTTS